MESGLVNWLCCLPTGVRIAEQEGHDGDQVLWSATRLGRESNGGRDDSEGE